MILLHVCMYVCVYMYITHICRLYVCMCISFRFFSLIGYFKILSIVPWKEPEFKHLFNELWEDASRSCLETA